MVTRISGLASGIDVDSMVKSLMNAEKIPLNKLKQKKQILEWQRDDYRAINTLLSSFKDQIFNMKLSSSYRTRTTSSTDESKVTATATSGAGKGSYAISNVTLATATSKTSGALSTDFKSTALLKSYFGDEITWQTDNLEESSTLSNGTQTISLNKTDLNTDSFSLKLGDTSYTAVLNAESHAYELISNETPSNKIGTIDFTTGKISLDKKLEEDTEFSAKYTQTYSQFSITTHTSKGDISKSIVVNKSDTLNSVISKVNSSELGITMFYDDYKKKISMTRTETGHFNSLPDGNDIEISGDFIEKVLKFDSGSEIKGENAKFTINGLETERSSNTFEMNGVTFTLKQKFTDAVTTTVGNDTTSVFNNIKNVVDTYNTLIATISGKLTEERNRDYQPLTNDERDAMSESQIEKWEKIAKAGLIRSDQTLRSVLSSMRSSFSNKVNTRVTSIYKQLSSVGITTTSDYLSGGKLQIDETKLKKALEEDPEGVEALFIQNGSTTSEKGIMTQLQDNLTLAISQLKDKAGNATLSNTQFTIGKSLTDVNKRITSFESKLTAIETRYYKQFSAMETAILKANSQSTSLSSYFSS